jgi:argininosuccinate lyase
MADTDSATRHKFVEGIGGRLSATKSDTYRRGVLAIEARNNPYTARYMLAGDLACVITAHELGVTPTADAKALVGCLLDLLPRAEQLARQDPFGDIVLQREYWVVDKLGPEVGSWLHVGRNRAESLRGSLPRMFFRDALHQQHTALLRLMRALVDKAEPVLEAVAPFYHHLQHAGRTSLGEYLLSWASNFNDHFDRISQADSRLDLAPPPNCGRDIVVELINKVGHRLGFSRVAPLWQQLFITEEFYSEPFFILVQIAVALGRLAEDLRLWMTSEFAFFELADQHASGSSGRPQKKNPFGLQAVISGAAIGAGRLAAQFATELTVSEEADSTYHAYSMFEFAGDVVAWTAFMAEVIETGQFKLAELEAKSTMGFAGAREALDILVYEHHVPYRAAHRVLGEFVRTGSGGADHATLLAQLRARLAAYPAIDVETLARVATGQSQAAIMLNLPAFARVHRELDARIKALVASQTPNPVDAAIEKLMAEGRAFLG